MPPFHADFDFISPPLSPLISYSCHCFRPLRWLFFALILIFRHATPHYFAIFASRHFSLFIFSTRHDDFFFCLPFRLMMPLFRLFSPQFSAAFRHAALLIDFLLRHFISLTPLTPLRRCHFFRQLSPLLLPLIRWLIQLSDFRFRHFRHFSPLAFSPDYFHISFSLTAAHFH